MATVSLIDPYSQQAEQIARRQRMAQALQERGSQVLEMPTMPGVLISPYAGLAKVLESGIGAYQEKKAQDDLNKLQTDYRNKYNTQFEDLAKAISAPAVPGVEGQEAVAPQEAVTEPIYGTMPDPTYGGFDVGLQTQDPSNVIGQKEISPSVPGREAIAPKAAIPAGYISPETLKGIDIPEVKQLAMARYLAQFEPKQVKLGQGESLYNQVGTGPLTPLVTGTTKADRLSPEWKETTQEVNGKPVSGWINLNASAPASTFIAGDKPKTTTPHYSEIESNGNVVIVDLNLPADQRLSKGQIKAPIRPDLEKIETRDDNNQPITRYIDKALLATMGDIKPQYKGFLSDLAEAGQLPKNWQSIPQIAGLVRENLINKAGGITPKDLANLKIRIAEAAAKLAYEGVPGFNTKNLTPPLSNFTTLGGGAPATSAASKITTAAEIADAAKRSGKSIEEVTRDAIAKGYEVQ